MPIDFTGIEEPKRREPEIDFSGIEGIDFSGVDEKAGSISSLAPIIMGEAGAYAKQKAVESVKPLRVIPAAIKNAALYEIPKGIGGALQLSAETGALGNILPFAQGALRKKILQEAERLGKEAGEIHGAIGRAEVPQGMTEAERQVYGATSSIAQNLPLMATGPAALPLMGTLSAGQERAELSAEGVPQERAIPAAVGTGVVEAITEKLPLGILKKQGMPFLKRLVASYLTDVPGELVATTTQLALDEWAKAPEKSLAEFKAKILPALVDTVIQTSIAGPVQTAAVHPFVKNIPPPEREEATIPDEQTGKPPALPTGKELAVSAPEQEAMKPLAPSEKALEVGKRVEQEDIEREAAKIAIQERLDQERQAQYEAAKTEKTKLPPESPGDFLDRMPEAERKEILAEAEKRGVVASAILEERGLWPMKEKVATVPLTESEKTWLDTAANYLSAAPKGMTDPRVETFKSQRPAGMTLEQAGAFLREVSQGRVPKTEAQKRLVEHAKSLQSEFDREEIPVTELKEGQEFTRGGEQYKVADVEDTGFPWEKKVTVKDSKTYHLEGDETIDVDKGSVKAPFALTASEQGAEKEKPKQQGFELGIKGEGLRAPEREGKAVSMEETELGRATKEAKDREKQGPLVLEPVGAAEERGGIKLANKEDLKTQRVKSQDATILGRLFGTLNVADKHPVIKPIINRIIKGELDWNHRRNQMEERITQIWDKYEKPSVIQKLFGRRGTGLEDIQAWREGKKAVPEKYKPMMEELTQVFKEYRDRVIEGRTNELLAGLNKKQREIYDRVMAGEDIIPTGKTPSKPEGGNFRIVYNDPNIFTSEGYYRFDSDEKGNSHWATFDKKGKLVDAGKESVGTKPTPEEISTWQSAIKNIPAPWVKLDVPLYLRFGHIPKSGKSKNYATGQAEAGLSTYEADYILKDGVVKFSEETSALPGAAIHAAAGYYGKTAYLVTGDIAGIGSDGEPLLKNVSIVKEVEYSPEHKGFIPKEGLPSSDSLRSPKEGDNAIEKVSRAARAKVEAAVKDVTEMQKWGLSPEEYFPHAFSGGYKFLDSSGNIVASGETARQASARLLEYAELHPDMKEETYIGTSTLAELYETRKALKEEAGESYKSALDYLGIVLPRKQYGALIGKANKAANEAARQAVEEAGLEEAGIKVKLDMRGVASPTPRKKFVGFMQKRTSNIKGDIQDPFKVTMSYIGAMERKFAADEMRKEVVPMIEALPASKQNLKDIATKAMDWTGHYSWENKLVDEGRRKLAETKVAKRLGVSELLRGKPYTATRAMSRVMGGEAMAKLGFAPVKALLNRIGGVSHTWIKENPANWLRGRAWLKTEEGKRIFKEYGHLTGMDQPFTASGRESYTKATGNLLAPLGMYNRAEFRNRPEAFAAAFVKAKQSGASEQQAIDTAIESARLTQGLYTMSSLPIAVRGPVLKSAYQFKQYMMNEARFMKSLTPTQWAAYVPYIMAMSGTRGTWLTVKSILPLTIIGALFLDKGDEEAEEMNVKQPYLHRGLPGVAFGVDVSAPATWQLPQRMKDLLGPTISDGASSVQMMVKGMKNSGWTADEIHDYFQQLAPTGYNIYKAFQILSEGKTERGEKTMRRNVNPWEAAINLAGARTVEESQEQDTSRYLKKKGQDFNERKRVMTDKFFEAREDGKAGEVLRQMIKEGMVPQKITESGLEYDFTGLKRSATDKQLTRLQRVIKTLPQPVKREYYKKQSEAKNERARTLLPFFQRREKPGAVLER